MKHLSRRGIIRVRSYLCALLLLLGALAAVQAGQKAAAWTALTAGWNHAFDEFSGSMEKLDAALQKSAVADGPALVSLSSEVSRESALALGALSSLPYSGEELKETSGFLCKLGDYAAFLARNGGTLSPEERENLVSLSRCAHELNGSLQDLSLGVADGSLSVGEALRRGENELGENVIGDGISRIELEFPEYPSLIYDGPFSEHISAAVPKLTEEAKELTREEAWKKAAALLGLRGEPVYAGETGGVLPCYTFAVSCESGSLYLDITKQGGWLLDLMCPEPTGSGNLSEEELLSLASEFAQRVFDDPLAETYHHKEDGVLTVNLAAKEGNVICYPDLVKVSLAPDGSIAGFEARGYLMNHTRREGLSPSVSEEKARRVLPASAMVDSVQMAVIPSAGKYERFCYEFLCTSGENRMLIYVNAETGVQEQVLLLLEDENGSLVMEHKERPPAAADGL